MARVEVAPASLYHLTLGLRVIEEKKKPPAIRPTPYALEGYLTHKKMHFLEPYRRPMPRVLGGS